VKGIENRIEVKASPRIVFRHLANPANIPAFVPGIVRADVTEYAPGGVGTRIALETRRHRKMDAVVTGEAERRFLAIQDERGTLNEWELTRTPTGTLAVNRIIGEFDDERLPLLSREARAKMHAFKDFVESRVAANTLE